MSLHAIARIERGPRGLTLGSEIAFCVLGDNIDSGDESAVITRVQGRSNAVARSCRGRRGLETALGMA